MNGEDRRVRVAPCPGIRWLRTRIERLDGRPPWGLAIDLSVEASRSLGRYIRARSWHRRIPRCRAPATAPLPASVAAAPPSLNLSSGSPLLLHQYSHRTYRGWVEDLQCPTAIFSPHVCSNPRRLVGGITEHPEREMLSGKVERSVESLPAERRSSLDAGLTREIGAVPDSLGNHNRHVPGTPHRIAFFCYQTGAVARILRRVGPTALRRCARVALKLPRPVCYEFAHPVACRQSEPRRPARKSAIARSRSHPAGDAWSGRRRRWPWNHGVQGVTARCRESKPRHGMQRSTPERRRRRRMRPPEVAPPGRDPPRMLRGANEAVAR